MSTTPKTDELWLKHVHFVNEDEAMEAICDFRSVCAKFEAEATKEREKVRVLREALMALRDQQNNADRPLCRAHWQMAMDEVGLALATTEPKP